jgi:hypothetical protein
MEYGDARTRTYAQLLEMCCDLPALHIKIAKADALARKHESGFLREALC